jgi:predicted dinucleotide-binding enzyme
VTIERMDGTGMTTISIVGAGNLARGLATRAVAAGYEVQLLIRDPSKGEKLVAELGTAVRVSPLDGGAAGDLVALAIPYAAVDRVMSTLGDLTGKTVIDATNPINETFTGLVTEPGASGAEHIAALAPNANVVKAFNTLFAGNVVAGKKNGLPLDVMIAGDDETAKAAVADFVDKTGFRVIDTGPLATAATLEGLAWMHMQLQFTRGTNFQSAIAIVD